MSEFAPRRGLVGARKSSPASYSSHIRKNKNTSRSLLRLLGPGIITGASDDDPSGIATYSQAGAQFGFGVLWMALFSYPLMCAVQEICARIGRVTGRGLTANLRKVYPSALVMVVVGMLLISSIFNLGADLAAMADAAHMLVGGPNWIHILWLGVGTLLLQVFVRYTRYVNYLKWLSLSILAYVVTGFLVQVPWPAVLQGTLMPPLHGLTRNYLMMAVAVLGTTISPYLFFWQASEEAEEVKDRKEAKALLRAPEQAKDQFSRIKLDTYSGMAASNMVAFFIMLTSAVTLHAHGSAEIQTAAEAAKALRPLAGEYAYILFSLGIIGTGLLAVPVLAGSTAYAVGEVMHWRVGLQAKPTKAPKFYLALVATMVIGLLLNLAHINPIKALFLAAVVNGVLAAPVMVMTMLLAQNPRVMKEFTRPRHLRIGGWIGTALMCGAAVAFLIQSL